MLRPWLTLLLWLPAALLIATFGSIIAVASWLLAVSAFDRLAEPKAVRLVRRYLRQQQPRPDIARLRLAATEPSRWVVCVAFGPWIPSVERTCFSVARPSGKITELHDCSTYLAEHSGGLR